MKGLAIGKTARPVEFEVSDTMAGGKGNESAAERKVQAGKKAANRMPRNKGRK